MVSGGNLDIDCYVKDPSEVKLYDFKRKNVESIQFLTAKSGVYAFCFANKFSTFTHKVVYFQLEVGIENEEDILFPGEVIHTEAYSTSENQLHTIHEKLKKIIDYQTHHRIKEVNERKFSEDLKDRVQLWSLLQFSIMIAVSLLQVMIVRSFFSNIGKRMSMKGMKA